MEPWSLPKLFAVRKFQGPARRVSRSSQPGVVMGGDTAQVMRHVPAWAPPPRLASTMKLVLGLAAERKAIRIAGGPGLQEREWAFVDVLPCCADCNWWSTLQLRVHTWSFYVFFVCFSLGSAQVAFVGTRTDSSLHAQTQTPRRS